MLDYVRCYFDVAMNRFDVNVNVDFRRDECPEILGCVQKMSPNSMSR